MKKFGIILVSLLLSSSLWAKRFSTEYTEFELPSGWECSLEGAEWVCQSSNKDRQKEAIIIMAAKEKGSQDNIQAYTAYLKAKKTYQLPNRKTQVSDPKYARLVNINDHKWVDALHLASEVPGFYTRYMATVKGDLGVAVTFSVGKDHYDEYKALFDKVVQSLRVFARKKGSVGKFQLKTKDANLLDSSNFIDTGIAPPRIAKQREAKKSGEGDDMMLLLLLFAAVVGFIIYKKKKG